MLDHRQILDQILTEKIGISKSLLQKFNSKLSLLNIYGQDYICTYIDFLYFYRQVLLFIEQSYPRDTPEQLLKL